MTRSTSSRQSPDRRVPESLSIDRLRGVCLERTIELASVRLQVRDWPGVGGPVIHVPDGSRASALIARLAADLAPTWRVLSISPRAGVPYQATAVDVVGVLDQFGFRGNVLVGEGAGCLTALLVAAWYPAKVSGLLLVDGRYDGDRYVRECPPDLAALRAAVRCAIGEASSHQPGLAQRLAALLTLP